MKMNNLVYIKDMAKKAEEPTKSIAVNIKSDQCTFIPTEISEKDLNFANVLTDCVKLLQRFVVMQESQAVVTCLWAAATWFIDSVDTVPYLLITSSTKRSGKTRLLDFLQQIVRHPNRNDDCSVAAIFRITNMRDRPTLLVDEVDQYMRHRTDFNSVLNSGNRRGAIVTRSAVSKNGSFSNDITEYDCFGFKAFAGINADSISDTLSDRSIIIKLIRKTERIERLRIKNFADEFESIRQKFYSLSVKFGDPVKEELDRGTIEFPEVFNDRQIDIYEILWALLECMSDQPFQDYCKQACERCLISPEPMSDLELLMQARNFSMEMGKRWVSTEELISYLDKLSAWKGISAKRLSCVLARFGVYPVRNSRSANKRGYLTVQLNNSYLKVR